MNSKVLLIAGAAVLVIAAIRCVEIEIVTEPDPEQESRRSKRRRTGEVQYVADNSYRDHVSHAAPDGSFSGGSFDGGGSTTGW